MESKLNNSPHLRMSQITKKLFNRNFLSDIRFSVEGKIIYAHALELMKRSEVFEKQLENDWGDKKMIPIIDCKYDNFLEFVRFIYTDECTINDGNGMELLKLAIKYKILMLESLVINKLSSLEFNISLFEHCVLENYEIGKYQYTQSLYCHDYAVIVKNQKFLSFHPDAIKVALQIDANRDDVKEIQRFDALATWIKNYCSQHQITISEGRQQFDGLFREIRFSSMSMEEVRDCFENHPGFLSDSDMMLIGKQIIFEGGSGNYASKSIKKKYEIPYELRLFNRASIFETKISVLKQTILHGLWVGGDKMTAIAIEITTTDLYKNRIEKIEFKQFMYDGMAVICLGDSLRLEPNFEYIIVIKYPDIENKKLKLMCRKKNTDLIYNDPDNCINVIKASDIMLEMIFKSATG